MSASQIPTGVTIIQSLSGFQAVSLTEFTTSAAPSIAAGSKVEIAGAFFQFVSDDTINASSWTAITTGTTAYIQLTPSGTAGSQIATASYTSTAPTWRDDLQGWYASAASSSRVIASVYKAEATSYQSKTILDYIQKEYDTKSMEIFLSSGTFIVPKGVDTVWLTGCAAGGNGGNGSQGIAGYSSGGGGGGGEIIWKKSVSVTSESHISVVIGAVGSNTSFGSISLNCGANGANGTSSGGAGGAGGILSGGTAAGANGGHGGDGSSSGTDGYDIQFAYPGICGDATNVGGGGAGGLGFFVKYQLSTSGGTTLFAGGNGGRMGGGGGGGGRGSDGVNGGNGGNAGYGSGGGGGGGALTTTKGTGGAGGPAILIVEW